LQVRNHIKHVGAYSLFVMNRTSRQLTRPRTRSLRDRRRLRLRSAKGVLPDLWSVPLRRRAATTKIHERRRAFEAASSSRLKRWPPRCGFDVPLYGHTFGLAMRRNGCGPHQRVNTRLINQAGVFFSNIYLTSRFIRRWQGAESHNSNSNSNSNDGSRSRIDRNNSSNSGGGSVSAHRADLLHRWCSCRNPARFSGLPM